jgi:uncharacterized membrane protein YhaH (DUF805 family)
MLVVQRSIGVAMLEIKDGGSELHISKGRLVGCGFSLLVFPIFLAFIPFHQTNRGVAAAVLTFDLLTVLYVKRRIVHDARFTSTMIFLFLVEVFIAMQPKIETFDPTPLAVFLAVPVGFFMIFVAGLVEKIFNIGSPGS